jgi:outer membrane autotransporter protein
MAVGGSGSTFSASSLATSGRINAGHFGVYAVKTWGSAYLAATVNYARLDNTTERTISGAGPTENASGHFAADQVSARIEFGRAYRFNATRITPFVAVEPAALWQHAYAETSTIAGGAGVLGLSYDANTVTSLPTFLGAQIDTQYRLLNGQMLSPWLRAAWVHEFSTDRPIQASFVSVPGTGFTVDGARPGSDALRLGAGATLAFNTNAYLFANLEGEFSNDDRTYAATGGIRLTW